ncbi:MAG: hypothetical protein GTO12_07595, partial [Proteobacteria bacterium]|nr:hypothetical protein [Pseudomonadota bacterium]
MIKHLRLHQVKGYLVGLCFFLALSASETPHSKATEKLYPSTKSPLEKAEFWLSQMAQTIGLSSLAFEIHGASLQISEIVAHLGQILPPGFDNWKPTGQVTFDFAMT